MKSQGIEQMSAQPPQEAFSQKVSSPIVSSPKISRRWSVGFGLILLAIIWLVVVAASWEAKADPDPSGSTSGATGAAAAVPDEAASTAAPNSSDEYSFKWLDPEKKIYVLQNRRYLKAHRSMLSVLAGPGLANSYRDTSFVSPRAAYYFSEWLGLEAFYVGEFNSENSTFNALKQAAPNALPVVREITAQYGINLQLVPFYAKINMFNKILYFDWYFSAGLGQVKARLDTRTQSSDAPLYTDENSGAVFLGTGQLFHITQNLTARFDFSSALYRASIFRSGGDISWFSNYLFGFGLGLRL